MEESLIFGSIIGHRKVNLENVFESLAGRGDEHDACPHAFDHERAIEVHSSILELLCDGRRLDFCPLGDEINEYLGLDGRPWLEGKLEGAELNRPLCNPSGLRGRVVIPLVSPGLTLMHFMSSHVHVCWLCMNKIPKIGPK